MKQYLHYFRWLFAAAAILVVLYLWLLWENHILLGGGERRNEECRTQERVFDYGDVLTEEEEEELRGLIAETEKRTCCDIVLVTLNESLKEYAREQEPDVPYREFVRVYAEEFYDSNAFGYNQPIGDGVVLVDNWYREDDGRVYTWLCAVGRAEEEYTESRIDSLLDAVYWYIEDLNERMIPIGLIKSTSISSAMIWRFMTGTVWACLAIFRFWQHSLP